MARDPVIKKGKGSSLTQLSECGETGDTLEKLTWEVVTSVYFRFT